ncbi:MAG: transglycosylase domain-containing protein [Candidatus Dormibacteraeota bacterium]|nr:transglycosylase domain-containing protein [Candidatus Dormibacteraeota bacterium]
MRHASGRRNPHRHAQYQIKLWRRRRRAGLRRIIILSLLAFFMLPLLTVPAVAAQTVGDLPAVTGLSSNNLQQDMLIYDRRGNLLADIGDQGDHRIVVPLGYISPNVINATIAIEDHTFYSNSGVDVGGTLRAALADYSGHGIKQGGSTITQQLVKQVFIGPHPDSTLQRKIKEAVLAVEVNKRYTKSEILGMYLNTIFYGSQTYGIEAAARSYFQSNAHDLTLAQASLLAGLPQAPTKYNPIVNLTSAKKRQLDVLNAMVDNHYITRAQADAAYAAKLTFYPPTNHFEAPHFVDYVLQTLRTQFHIQPTDRRGYRVYTSLDLGLQHLAEGVVRDQIAQKGNFYNFHDAALVSMDPRTGEILAMVGGNDYNRPGGQINMANTPRQPGSTFKIYTYTAAIESRKFNMITPILDAPLVFPVYGGDSGFEPYMPLNYDLRFHGQLPLKMAMGNSMNIPALKTELRVGIPSVLDVARRMGVTHLTQPDENYSMSLTLGSYEVTPVDMVTGASTLATLGVRHMPAPVLSVKDGLGHDVITYDPLKNEYRAISPQVAFIIGSIMSDDRNRCLEFGCNGDLTLPGRHVAAKTGTTQDFHDNWTVGFTPTLATAVWVGNPDNKPLSHNSTGIVGAAPIWHKFMQQALASTPDQWYTKPAGLDQIGDNYFLPGTENVRSQVLAWPTCRFGSYNPYNLTYADILVDGVPCVLGGGARPITLRQPRQ